MAQALTPARVKKAAKRLEWRDLVHMHRRDGAVECLHPVPWLAASLLLLETGYWPLAILCEFMFFLTALRLNHEAIHHNLGFGPAGHRMVLHSLSLVMLGSNHSVAFNHLRHHAHINTDRDLEGKAGQMGLLRVLAYGPVFPIECHLAAWRDGGPAWRRKVGIDLALNTVLPALALLFDVEAVAWHFGMMLVAQCFTALFAVWITHRGCHGSALVARSQRNGLVNAVSYNMFFHLEHHLFPAVPVRSLPELARRLDRLAPELRQGMKPVIGS